MAIDERKAEIDGSLSCLKIRKRDRDVKDPRKEDMIPNLKATVPKGRKVNSFPRIINKG